MLNSTDEISILTKFVFNSFDYAVFGIMLGISALIGIYFGFFDKSSDTTEEYLLGGKKMKVIPIAISLVASQLSAISIMSIPVELYLYGAQYWIFVLVLFLVFPILCFVIIPVFYKNNIANCYEYLEMRFNKNIRRVTTVSFVITVYLMIPVYIFIPSLAFSQVTGFNLHLINVIVCSVCVFYTMMGGIKAVVWTDVVQGIIMLGSVLLVGVLAIIKIGGLQEVIDRAILGQRIQKMNMSFNFTERETFWNCFFGGFILWISHVGVHQTCVQRIVSLPSLKHAQISLAIFCIGCFIVMSLNCFTGIIMFARYYLCDPVKAGIVDKTDKLMPFFVQDVIGHLKGMPGLFISCVFSAALSTMSANLNTMAGLVYFDYVKPYIDHTEKKANFIMKIIVAVNGVYCILGGIVVSKIASILQIAMSIAGIAQGAVAGVFLLGMLCPKAHSKPALIATLTSMAIMAVIVIGTQVQLQTELWKHETLPTRIDPEGCSEFGVTINETTYKSSLIVETNSNDNNPWTVIFRISFVWFTFIGAVLVWLIALPLSYFMKNNEEKKLDINLISPVIHCFLDEYSPNEEKPLK